MGEDGRAVVETRDGAQIGVNGHSGGVLNGHANGAIKGLTKRPETTEPAEAALKIVFTAEDRERLVATHIPLVHRLCRRFHDCLEPQEDLVQVGCIGLLKASKKFDPDRGTSSPTRCR